MKIAMIIPDNRDEFGRHNDPAPYFGPAPSALLEGLVEIKDCEIHIVACVHRPMVAPGKIAANIYYHAVKVGSWGWSWGGYLGCVWAVRQKLREIQPDLVHGQGTERYCAQAAVFSGFPNVITIHGNMQAIAAVYRARFGSFHWRAARLETFALRRTDGVFCNSAYTEALVAPRAARTWRVANALRTDFFSKTPPVKPTVAPVILNIGVAEPRKQQVELLAVARRLHAAGLKFELQFAGSLNPKTAYGAVFVQELARAEAAGYARHLGNLPAAQLIAAMDAAAALVHFPSEEAFGLVVAEALARNLKFFGAAAGGVMDIATGVEGAELFTPQDFVGLETAIARWLHAGGPQPQNAAILMCERYHPLVIAKKHLAIYREVIEQKLKTKNGCGNK